MICLLPRPPPSGGAAGLQKCVSCALSPFLLMRAILLLTTNTPSYHSEAPTIVIRQQEVLVEAARSKQCMERTKS